jgi:hypothetical protein
MRPMRESYDCTFTALVFSFALALCSQVAVASLITSTIVFIEYKSL